MSTVQEIALDMTFMHPSAIWAKVISAECLFLQSWSCKKAGRIWLAMGITALPPRAMASLSRPSRPTSNSSPFPMPSSSSRSAACHSGSSSMSSKKHMRAWKSLPMNCGSFLIIPGAFSLASVRVTRNSEASCLVDASRLAASMTVRMAFTNSIRFLRKKVGCSSPISMNIPSVSWAVASSPWFSAVPKQLSMLGTKSWNLSLSLFFSSEDMKEHVALSAAFLMSTFWLCRLWPNTLCRVAR
mmetsp:Transcript_122/g.525  ORF Transcript_122/g.525 Transcript_122/m.525 type:complete len:242 (+) Transcript_122:3171-3896(+)